MRLSKLMLSIGMAVPFLALSMMPAYTWGSAVSAAPSSDRGGAVLAATPAPTLQGVVLATSGLATPTPSPTSPGAGARDTATSYTVKRGDTLYSIARSFGLKYQGLQAANGIDDPDSIKAGQVLLIPAGGGSSPTPSAATATPTPPASSPTATATPTPAQATPTPEAPGPTPTPTAAPTVSPQPSPAGEPKGDPRYFDQTGFRVANDQFWDFFNRRGGVRTFGYPISKEFLLFGFRVQFYQRLIMQLNPDGSVATMNLLDEGLMPYTRVNFSTFPAPDKAMAAAAPGPGADDYFGKLLAFVKEKSPDKWNDLPANFNKAFNETVRYEDAYPDGKQDPGIMPAINLELWGVPTSAPAFDPTNNNFAYLRFQRGIMHYDKTTGTTQGLLLADYLKSIITGWNLPPDLDEQARGSRFYRQYNPLAANGLHRANELPGTDMRGAFTRDGLVVLDPGHGGTQIGAAWGFADGTILIEKDLNLKVALKTAELLRQAGRQVMLTRTSDTQVNNPPKDVTGNGRMTLDDDLQSRIDVANSAGAELFLSIHFNGSTNPDNRGAEVYYNAKRPFSDKNKKFAEIVQENLIGSTKAAGFNLLNRGIKEDERAVGKGNSLYLLGPTGADKPRAAEMVGVLGEGAFLTNNEDATMVREEKFLDALAEAYARSVQQYFQSIGK